jgi:4-amino-4-deoxy-L-arabinose transferase-like glycosyltransferase
VVARVQLDRFTLLALLAAVVGAAHGLVYVPFAGHVLGDSPTYTTPAHALLSGGYSTPLPAMDVTGLRIPPPARGRLEPQTYRTPGYPLLLAAAGGGTSSRSTDVVIGLQAALAGATVFLLALAFRRLWGERTALLGAYLAALDPFTKHYVTRILSEVLAGFLVAAAVYAFVRAWQTGSRTWWAAFGLLGAALSLTRPLFLFVVPLGALAALVSGGTARARLLAATVTAVAAVALLTPWLVWTSSAVGHPVMQSFGEGWNLLIAAHGEGLHHTAVEVEASTAYRRDFDSVHELAPSPAALARDPDAHARYLARADARQRDLALDLYGERLRHEPLRVLGEIVYRGYFLWMAHEDWRQPGGWPLLGLRLVDWLTLLLTAAGMLVAFRAGGLGRAPAVFLLVFTLVNAVHHVEARYAMPVRGLALGYAALALAALYAHGGRIVSSGTSRVTA